MKSIKKTYTNRIEYSNESGEFHREDGPALIYNDGHTEWWLNGKLHRIGGPAVIHSDTNYKAWYLNDVNYYEKDYKIKLNKLKKEVLNIF